MGALNVTGIVVAALWALVANDAAYADLPTEFPDELCKSLPKIEKIPDTLVISENIDIPSGVQLSDLYARIELKTEACAGTKGTKDTNRLKQMAARLGFDSAKTVSTMIRVGDLPPLQLVSYNLQDGDRTSSIVANRYFPWQPASQITKVVLENRSTTATTVGAASVLTHVGDLLPPETAILAPASIIGMKAAAGAAQKILDAFSRDKNGNSYEQSFDPSSLDGGSIVYLLDSKGLPLVAVSMKLVFTPSLAQPTVASGIGNVKPTFTSLPLILSKVTIDSGNRTLRDALGSDSSALAITRADANTPPAEYAKQCRTLKTRLSNNFGLNRFDTLLALTEWLSENSYVSTPALHNSGCLQAADKALLKDMGLEHVLNLQVEPPKAVTLEAYCSAMHAALGVGDITTYGDAFKPSVPTMFMGTLVNYSPTKLLDYVRLFKGIATGCRLEGNGDASYYVFGFSSASGTYEIEARGTNNGPSSYEPVRGGIGQVEIKETKPKSATTPPSV